MRQQLPPGVYARQLSRRDFLRLTVACAAGMSVAGAGGYEYANGIEPGWLDVVPVRLTLPRLPAAFDGYRVVQISDIHMGGWTTRDRLRDIIAQANAQQPDLIAITGDFVSGMSATITQDLVDLLGTLRVPDGVVAVLGNHDHWNGAAMVREVLFATGITDVSNGVHTLARGPALLHIAGVDDIWERKDRLDAVLDALPREGAALLLAHEPDFADTSAATGRFDLQLSGHSHGGQVVIPGLGAPNLPDFGRKYYSGLYRVGDMLQYTNRGVGMIRPYVRFNCRPEITVFTFAAGTT